MTNHVGALPTFQISCAEGLGTAVYVQTVFLKPFIREQWSQMSDCNKEPIFDGSLVTAIPLASMISNFSSAVP